MIVARRGAGGSPLKQIGEAGPRLLAASLIPAAITGRARRLRERLRSEVDRALATVDVLASPTAPTVAPPISTVTAIGSKEEAWGTVLAGRSAFTNPFSLTGHPALSVPCGFTAEGLPAGLQLIGRPLEEALLLRVAHIYQTLTEWRRKRPDRSRGSDTGLTSPAPTADP